MPVMQVARPVALAGPVQSRCRPAELVVMRTTAPEAELEGGAAMKGLLSTSPGTVVSRLPSAGGGVVRLIRKTEGAPLRRPFVW